ncbi:MAG: response regulator, partial [Chroococcidiopsidaceae cyanobacterium CP_BM_ER_R8_30]|nr:response regulator [Chroococcidiopsidaceae cyanobacterium CP_BM_ER_R8_30]
MTHESTVPSTASFLQGGGEMGARVRAYDWSQTSLGAPEQWQQSLKTAVRIMLTSRQPMWVWWGEDLINLYNDAYRTILGGKHPEMLGQPASVVWHEIWDQVGPRAELVMFKNEATYDESLLLIMERNGYPEETYYTFSYSPIPDDQGGTGGILCANTDNTQQVIGERQLTLLRELAAKTADARTFDEACTLSAKCLETNPYDLPFAMIYLVDSDQQVSLAGTSGIERGHLLTPETVVLDQDSTWCFSEAIQSQQPVLVSDLARYVNELPTGAWQQAPHQAVVLPIVASGKTGKAGILLVGLNPFRLFDDNYRGFLDLVSGQIAASIANAQAYEEERKRAEAFAELDRAKTVFFSNISHEFRTPLTLMLGPTEDALSDLADPLSPTQQARIEIVQRNGQRLLKLVNTLLDFSRIEAGRVQAVYEPTDLAAFTAELASIFRSAIERANMRLLVDCPPLPEPVYVDREMWEKILLNLLSNAFKFTFTGDISIHLQWQDSHIQLAVRDTGIGIPATELPHLFERFHRVKGSQGRSFEGSGIGLSLVQELVKLHQGTIEVASVEGEGTCFTIAIPTGTAHLPQDRIRATHTLTSTASGANVYVEEALRWLPEAGNGEWGMENEYFLPSLPPATAAHILLADDNADMRDYIKRLLGQQYEVEAVSDGMAALAAVRQQVPDLVLTDVMMPQLDGFGLLQALRAAPQTREVPIILLSARAGEEARVEGLAAGADDYLTKPFSARELMARVEASLKLAQLRREAGAALRESEERYRMLFESIDQGFCIIEMIFNDADQPIDYRFLSANPAFDKQTGRENVLGKTVREIASQHEDYWLEIYGNVAVTGEAIRFENRAQEFQRWYEVYAFRVGEPELRRVGVLFNDISERKQAEAEREQLLAREQAAREQAEQANRIKDEFLAVLSHELRSPLNPILGWSQLLQNGKLDAAKTKQALTTIERNAKLQSELIEDLLDVSRILQGKLSLTISPVNLATTIQAALETVRLAAEAKSIQVELTLNPEVGQVLGDATRLQQVVWNLLSNAVKFTPAGGQVAVRLEQIDEAHSVALPTDHRINSRSQAAVPSAPGGSTSENVDHQAQITVSDTGKGIACDFLPH